MEQSENTREKIIKVAFQVFVEKGYDGARMQEIAEKAGVNKAMIYYYFNSKELLFEKIITETLDSFFQRF